MAQWGRETAADTDAVAGDNDDHDGPGLQKTTIDQQLRRSGLAGGHGEDASDNKGFGSQRRQGEGEEEAREARYIDGASRLEERESRWILVDDNDVPPPADLMSPRGEGC